MAYCSNCGTQLSDAATACPQCGHPKDAAVARRTEGTAIAALVLGVAGFVVCPLIPSIFAIVLGNQARSKIRSDPTLEGEGLARAGVILGWIGVALAAFGLVFVIFAFVLSAGTFFTTGVHGGWPTG